ncbi:hypothetical protein LSH36_530g03020 [Paralvinella palmiformis]|uniref:Apple domain-containing protein n=1 Tax=Paralvinella palmiformis TaxID=53620 RepID=A0AAD9J7G7_9ANNE|nr:hypothetical protein LSH36_530g03020 [Paralvinella palmiformis]
MKLFEPSKLLITLLHLFILDLVICSLAVNRVPRSCEESLAFGRNYTGLHTLRSLDGANYTAFCQFEASTHTGLTFVSKFAVAYHDLDIHLMFTDRDHVVVRFINNDDIQSEAILRQLPEYVDTLLGIQQSTADTYTDPMYTDRFGHKFLLLGFLHRDQANRKSMSQGWMSNGREIRYTNCDGHANNYMIFYPDVGVGDKPSNIYYEIVTTYLNSRIATKLEHYLSRIYEFNYTGEMHFGGCGALSCSRYWNIKGLALGLPFRSLPGNHSDTYKQLKDPLSWPCPCAISDVIAQVTRLRCAELCTERTECMTFAIDGANSSSTFGSGISRKPRSCEESLAFGNNFTGIHTLQSLDGAKYITFCQFDHVTRTGLTFVSKYGVQYNELELDLMFTDRGHVVVRFLNNDCTQSEAVLAQLQQYAHIPLGIQQNTSINYTNPKFTSNFGAQFLLLGFPHNDQANKKGMLQGLVSNG